jgi:acetoin utilization deacetylase AcuC-like enzyme
MAAARFYYCRQYVYDVLERGIRHPFDVLRPRKIRDALVRCGALNADDFVTAPPLDDDDLTLVHTPAYVAAIKNPETLARYLLLDPAHPWGAGLLAPFLHAAGGTLAATRFAVRHNTIAVNLAGGYHHAQPEKAEGFCAIADVAIAIRRLRSEGFLDRVLIVDLDAHHGNGNAIIFAHDESVFTFSVHDVRWCDVAKRNHLDIELPPHTGDATYLAVLAEHLPRIVREFAPALAVYVAGSDPYARDPLGVFDLSEGGIFERDRFVTEETLGRGIPLAVVTAGGYGEQSWRLYYNYFRWLLDPRFTPEVRHEHDEHGEHDEQGAR